MAIKLPWPFTWQVNRIEMWMTPKQITLILTQLYVFGVIHIDGHDNNDNQKKYHCKAVPGLKQHCKAPLGLSTKTCKLFLGRDKLVRFHRKAHSTAFRSVPSSFSQQACSPPAALVVLACAVVRAAGCHDFCC